MKKIEFNRASDIAGLTGHSPSVATKHLPKWFKELNKYMGGERKTDLEGNLNFTIKACPPFLDSMMSGYMISTEFDMNVSWIEGEPHFEWRAGGRLISHHGKQQLAKEQIPEGFSDQPLKFNNPWQIVTPKGYSILFTHPLNREDLPFRTISGIVETDIYKNTINFPFLIKENFEGLIPAGTPIIQITPFKREVWQMKIGDGDPKEINDSRIMLNHKLMGGYKTQWWRRKEYR